VFSNRKRLLSNFCKNLLTGSKLNRQTGRQADRQIGRQADRQLTYFPRHMQISRPCVSFRFHAVYNEWKDARSNKQAWSSWPRKSPPFVGSEIYYNCLQSNYPLDPIPNQLNSAHTITNFFMSILILSAHLRRDLYPSGFRTKMFVHFSSSMHDIRSFHRTNNI
jgi:hypothetical protein